ncbi:MULTISPECIES: hypothetical protein [unclassified Lysobacter]
MTVKPPIRPLVTAVPYARRVDLSRQITSEHINEHLAAFEAAGGHVEVLGNTPTRKRKDDAPPVTPSE